MSTARDLAFDAFRATRDETRSRLRRHSAPVRREEAPSIHEPELERQTLIGEQRRMAILAPILTGLVMLVAVFGMVAHARGVLPPAWG